MVSSAPDGAVRPSGSRRRTWHDLGPGLLLAATGIGVGDMVGATIAGAEYGLTLLWAVGVGVLIKYAITEGTARWQLATGVTLMEGWRDHLPRWLLGLFLIYFTVWSYVTASAMVAASAMVPAAIIPSVPLPVWGVVHAVAALVMVLVGRYERFVEGMKWLIGLMFGCLLVTNVLILVNGADWTVTGNQPDLELPYVLSLIGGVGGTVTLLSYGYWMREQGWHRPERIGSARVDLVASFSLVGLFSLAMVFLSTQIGWEGRILDQGPQLCLMLADRIAAETGPMGRTVFLVGFWGAAYSSVLGVWHGVPFLFDDWVHLRTRQPAAGPTGAAYRGWAVYLTLASISALIVQRPVWIVFVYTVVGSLFFPFVIATLLWLCNSAAMPAACRNGTPVNVALGLALLLYVYLGVGAIPWP
jgi:Mn2+/Fe2+ NRAMP family transporter